MPWPPGRVAGTEWLVGVLHRESQELQNEWVELDANPQRRRSDHWLAKLVFAELSYPLRITASGSDRRSETEVESVVLQPGRFANTIGMLGDDRSQDVSLALDQTRLDVGPFRQIEWSAHGTRVEQLTFETRRAVAPRTPALQLDRQFRYEAREFGTRVTAAIDRLGSVYPSLGIGSGLFAAGYRRAAERAADHLAVRANVDHDSRRSISPAGFSTVSSDRGRHVRVRRDPARGLALDLESGAANRSPSAHADTGYDLPRGQPYPDRWLFETHLFRPGSASRIDGRTKLSIFGQYTHGFRSPPFEDVNIGLDLPQFRASHPQSGAEAGEERSFRGGASIRALADQWHQCVPGALSGFHRIESVSRRRSGEWNI